MCSTLRVNYNVQDVSYQSDIAVDVKCLYAQVDVHLLLFSAVPFTSGDGREIKTVAKIKQYNRCDDFRQKTGHREIAFRMKFLRTKRVQECSIL